MHRAPRIPAWRARLGGFFWFAKIVGIDTLAFMWHADFFVQPTSQIDLLAPDAAEGKDRRFIRQKPTAAG